MRKIGKIKSTLLSQNNRFSALGNYELDIEIDEAALAADPDKFGFVKHTIAKHIAGCCADTGLPPNEKIWRITLMPWIRKEFPSLPEEFLA